MALAHKILQVICVEHVAVVATISDGHPAVGFMALNGFNDLSLYRANYEKFQEIQQIIKNPNVALSIWSGKSFSDPYVVIQSRAEVHEDLETKKKYWNPKMEAYFQNLRTLLMLF